MDKIGIYIRDEEKIFLEFGEEILYFQGQSLIEILENISEEYNFINGMKIEIVLHFSYFNMEKNGDVIGIKVEKLKEIKDIIKKLKWKLNKICMDTFCIFNLYLGKNVEVFQVGERESISFKIDNGKMKDFETHNFNISDFQGENDYDFGDMVVFSQTEESVKDIFLGAKKNSYNFLKIDYIRKFKTMVKIDFKMLDIIIILFMVIVPFLVNSFLNIGKINQEIKKYRKELKLREEELKNFQGENFDNYDEELKMLEEIDNELKRKEYYTFILELLKLSFNGINYRRIIYENEVWKIEGSGILYDNIMKFERELKRKYERIKLGYLKDDNDGEILFEYLIMKL